MARLSARQVIYLTLTNCRSRDSAEVLPGACAFVEEPALFWLDAHFRRRYGSGEHRITNLVGTQRNTLSILLKGTWYLLMMLGNSMNQTVQVTQVRMSWLMPRFGMITAFPRRAMSFT